MNTFYKYFSFFIIGLLAVLSLYIFTIFYYKSISTRNLIRSYHNSYVLAQANLKNNIPFRSNPVFPVNKPIKILVLEGGGLRGIISMKILAYLEKKSHKHISQLFDVISGISIGGLQAAALSVPNESDKNQARYSAQALLNIFEAEAPEALQQSLYQKLITGFGFVTPIINTKQYALLLEKFFGNTQLSQLQNLVLLYGYNLKKQEISIFRSRGPSDSANFLLKQLVLGFTSIPGIMPAQEVYAINSKKSYLLTDPTLSLNNPTIASLFYINKIYPNNPKIIVFIGLGEYGGQELNKKLINNGVLSSLTNYSDMIFASQNRLDRFYIDELEESKYKFHINEAGRYFINETVPFNFGSPIDASKENIKNLNHIADYIISKNQKVFDSLIEQLEKN